MQTIKKELKSGETWIYPLRLEKGIKYSISTSGSEAAISLKSSLLNNHKRLLCESGKSRKTHISLIPEENGFHKLMVALDEEGESSHDSFLSTKVCVTVKKEGRTMLLLGGILSGFFRIVGYGWFRIGEGERP